MLTCQPWLSPSSLSHQVLDLIKLADPHRNKPGHAAWPEPSQGRYSLWILLLNIIQSLRSHRSHVKCFYTKHGVLARTKAAGGSRWFHFPYNFLCFSSVALLRPLHTPICILCDPDTWLRVQLHHTFIYILQHRSPCATQHQKKENL